MKMRYISYIKGKEAQRGAGIHKWRERHKDAWSRTLFGLIFPEALGIGSSVALKDKELNALQNLARLTSPFRKYQGTSRKRYLRASLRWLRTAPGV